jgi:hypothetical protein
MFSLKPQCFTRLFLGLLICLPTLVQAKVVVLAMDVELDQVAPEDAAMYRVGGHDIDRVSYDDSKVDPTTHKVPVLSLSHYIAGRWMPTEPTEASALDLSAKPYRLDFTASVNHGRPIVALFESGNSRMAMLARPDFQVLIAGKYLISSTPLTESEISAVPPNAHDPNTMPILSGMPRPANGPPAAPSGPAHRIVALDVEIILDQVAKEEKGMKAGQRHNARVFYDEAAVDPSSHRVALMHEQHTPMLIPKHLNPAQMPMSNAWLDLSDKDIKYHFAAAPTVGFPFPYFILFDETTHRMTIRRQSDGKLLLAGPYLVKPEKITGTDIDAAVSQYDPAVPPWVTTIKFPEGAPGEHPAAQKPAPPPG